MPEHDYPQSVEFPDHKQSVAAFEKYAKAQRWDKSIWWEEWLVWKAAVRWARLRRTADRDTV